LGKKSYELLKGKGGGQPRRCLLTKGGSSGGEGKGSSVPEKKGEGEAPRLPFEKLDGRTPHSCSEGESRPRRGWKRRRGSTQTREEKRFNGPDLRKRGLQILGEGGRKKYGWEGEKTLFFQYLVTEEAEICSKKKGKSSFWMLEGVVMLAVRGEKKKKGCFCHRAIVSRFPDRGENAHDPSSRGGKQRSTSPLKGRLGFGLFPRGGGGDVHACVGEKNREGRSL